mmetsp:Transcript_124582/g.346935  ORF Transcript_124582/g.346935 Transcript_124582/m.346935 type:complete len:270 (+) Transcript_124582:524-1333(+)
MPPHEYSARRPADRRPRLAEASLPMPWHSGSPALSAVHPVPYHLPTKGRPKPPAPSRARCGRLLARKARQARRPWQARQNCWPRSLPTRGGRGAAPSGCRQGPPHRGPRGRRPPTSGPLPRSRPCHTPDAAPGCGGLCRPPRAAGTALPLGDLRRPCQDGSAATPGSTRVGAPYRRPSAGRAGSRSSLGHGGAAPCRHWPHSPVRHGAERNHRCWRWCRRPRSSPRQRLRRGCPRRGRRQRPGGADQLLPGGCSRVSSSSAPARSTPGP